MRRPRHGSAGLKPLKSTPFSSFFQPSGFLTLLIAILSFVLALTGSMDLLQRVFCPFQVNQGEAINVEFARILSGGSPLYHDPSMGPYLYPAYPPLFALLQSGLMKVLEGQWLPGRLLALAGYWGCALALGFWGWRHWHRRAALAITFLFLLSPTWAAWGSMVRVDSLMIALEFSAFLLLVEVYSGRGKNSGLGIKRILLLAGLLTSLALMLKQNAVLLILAYGTYCFLEKKWKDFGTYCLTAVILPALLFLFLQWKTDGWFLKYILFWSPLGFEPALLGHYLLHDFLPECGWLLVGVLAAWVFAPPSRLIQFQVLFALLWVLGLGREGAAENYYLEFQLYGLFFIGEVWAFSHASRVQGSRGKLQNAFPLLLVLGFLSFSLKPWPSAPPFAERQMKAKAMAVYQEPGEHLALDLDLPLMAGKKLWIQPREYTWMVEKGIWSAEPLLNDIRTKKFSTVELYDLPEQYLLPKIVVDEIRHNYHVKIRNFGRLWFAPNG